MRRSRQVGLGIFKYAPLLSVITLSLIILWSLACVSCSSSSSFTSEISTKVFLCLCSMFSFQALEQRVEELEEENKTLRAALNLPPANRPTLGKGPTGKDKPKHSSSLSASPPLASSSHSQQDSLPIPQSQSPAAQVESPATQMHHHPLASPNMTMSNTRSMPQPMMSNHEHAHQGYGTHPVYQQHPRNNVP